MPRPTEWSPDWELSPAFIPKQRYLSPAFAAWESERLWPRLWRVACREDELAAPGAFVEYRIGDESILVVRSGVDELKAFFNSCRHRGRRLAEGSGRFEGRTIRCPTQGWCWKLDGRSQFVMDRGEFRGEHVDEARLHLVQCRLDTWAGFVWIHMDPDAEPLADHLASLGRILAPFELERTHPIFHKRVVLNANWKTALDTVNQGYHALAIHPETRSVSTDNADARYFQVENGHSYDTYAPDMLERSARRLGHDPDRSVFEIWSTRTFAESEERPPYTCQQLEPGDVEGWGLVPSQDLANLEAAHVGMKSRGFEGLVLNRRQEMGLYHMHREMDRVMRD